MKHSIYTQLRIVLCGAILWGCILTSQASGEPKRIVSLSPSITLSLYKLNVQKRIVGRTSYCKSAPGDSIPIVSSAIKANIEKVISLRPDSVLASSLTPPKEIETIRKFGINVQVYSSPNSFQEICDQFESIGQLCGKGKEAERIIASIQKEVNGIRAKYAKRSPRPKIFFQLAASPIFTVLPNTFMNDYITFLGGENIAASLTKGTLGREYVLAMRPDYIFVASMGIISENECREWRRYTQLPATQKRQIYSVDSNMACQYTPMNFLQTLNFMDRAIHRSQKK